MKRALVILAVLLWAAPPVHAAELKADAAIASVIVYPDRALVTRTATLRLQPGEQTVTFENLPTNIDTESLRTKGRGEARVRILSLESRKIILERPREEQIAKLEDQIQEARDRIAATGARIENLEVERELVRSISVYTGEQFSKEFITRQPAPEEWGAMLEFQRENLARISGQIQEKNIEKRDLKTELDALLRKLQQLRGQSARESLQVKVTLSATTAGPFELSLSGVVFGAGWHPSYDARADVRHEKVEMIYLGNIRQNTGEDWNDVEVSLSTARPAVGARMPEISPWHLRPRPPIEPRALEQRAREDIAFKAAAAPPAEIARAEIVPLGASVQFKAPQKMDVPSDNAHHGARILAEELPAGLSYSATPRLSPFAYLTAKVTNTTGAHWLAGPVSVFVDGDFIGKSGIEAVAPNEKIDLGLGIDESIKITREELVRKEDETRIFAKRKEHRFKDKITAENHKSRAIELLLLDQIPVPRHEDIEVDDVEFSVEPTERDADTGIVKWKLSLAPGQKKEITIEFTVTHPLDMKIIGL